MNTGYFVSRCLCCGKEHREALETDEKTLWVGCPECGHVYKTHNRVKWN